MATNEYGSDTETKIDYIIVTEPSIKVKEYSNTDIAVTGEMSGYHTFTHLDDNVYEIIKEVLSDNHPRKKTSHLEHKWLFNIDSGNSLAFYLKGYRSVNSDGDDFVFEYSTDDTNYYGLVTVSSATEQLYMVQLPASLSGNVYVRVTDSNRSWDNVSLDSIYIDEMYFEVDTTPTPPIADFIGEPISGYAPLNVQFTDLSSGGPTYWSWDFGDGIGTSTDPSPTYIYEFPGTYTVTLTVTNDSGSDTSTKVEYIDVNELTGTTVHVEKIIVTRITTGRNKTAQAEVTVFDQYNIRVSGAVVFGTFDLPNETVKSGTTGTDGVALISGDKTRDNIDQFCFTVTNIDLSGATYDPSGNTVTVGCEGGM
jgi:PKD repeat protein